MHRSKQHFYSITLSAAASRVFGTVRPSAFAVLRIITDSNLLGRWAGSSLGIGTLEDAIDVGNRMPHYLNRALAIDFCITHFEVIF